MTQYAVTMVQFDRPQEVGRVIGPFPDEDSAWRYATKCAIETLGDIEYEGGEDEALSACSELCEVEFSVDELVAPSE